MRTAIIVLFTLVAVLMLLVFISAACDSSSNPNPQPTRADPTPTPGPCPDKICVSQRNLEVGEELTVCGVDWHHESLLKFAFFNEDQISMPGPKPEDEIILLGEAMTDVNGHFITTITLQPEYQLGNGSVIAAESGLKLYLQVRQQEVSGSVGAGIGPITVGTSEHDSEGVSNPCAEF